MKNIVVLADSSYSIDCDGDIVSIAYNHGLSQIYLLINTGAVLCCSYAELNLEIICSFTLTSEQEGDKEWFNCTYIIGTGSLACISHSGGIAEISEEQLSSRADGVAEEIGSIDGGISEAQWNPEQTCLVILTNNQTVMSMANTWEPMQEIPLPSGGGEGGVLLTSISWKADGDMFALSSHDADEKSYKMRLFSTELEVLATARNIADGPSSVMKGVGGACSFAPNSSYIALSQQRVKGKHQVAFIEKNGLRHDDFDVLLPPVPAGFEGWEVCRLDWDLPSAILAVGLRAVSAATATTIPPVVDSTSAAVPGVLQLYYRSNYHWQMKQQWMGSNLTFLGFDDEVVNRMYISETVLRTTPNSTSTSTSIGAMSTVFRTIDYTWDVDCSSSADASVCVADGSKFRFTPLGKNVIPPPMSLYEQDLQGSSPKDRGLIANANAIPQQQHLYCRHLSFWSPYRNISAPPGARGVVKPKYAWGFAALSHRYIPANNSSSNSNSARVSEEDPAIVIYLGKKNGRLLDTFYANVRDLIEQHCCGATPPSLPLPRHHHHGEEEEEEGASSNSSGIIGGDQHLCGVVYRGLSVVDNTANKKMSSEQQQCCSITVVLLGSRKGHISKDAGLNISSTDQLLVLELQLSHEKIECVGCFAVRDIPGNITRLTSVSWLRKTIFVGLANTDTDSFDIIKLNVDTANHAIATSNGRRGSDVLINTVSFVTIVQEVMINLPETCSHIAVISGKAMARHQKSENNKKTPHPVTAPGSSSSSGEAAVEEEGEEGFSNGSSAGWDNIEVTVGQTIRNRLYARDVLLAHSASSFMYNASYGMLMFTTLSTRPNLHFASYLLLAQLDPMVPYDEQRPVECAPPRPLERGARLVGVVEGDCKVVVQMPRGNLEAFEPRPLILKRAQALITRDHSNTGGKYLLECLVLLRRQRVDLNYIIDYNPKIFLSNIDELVSAVMSTNHELLSLFISSIDAADLTLSKYPRDDEMNAAAAAAAVSVPNFVGRQKVNTVCRAIMGALLKLMSAGYVQAKVPVPSEGGSETDTGASLKILTDAEVAQKSANLVQAAMNPLLCTFAQQKPPLIVEALDVIRLSLHLPSAILPTKDSSSSSSSSGIGKTSSSASALLLSKTIGSSGNETPEIVSPVKEWPDAFKHSKFRFANAQKALSSPFAAGSLKYLAFLVADSELFDAALGNCDFDTARAVARQSTAQMDPRVYLPLLDGFEKIARGYSSESPQYALMRYQVNVHLKRRVEAVKWGAKFLDRCLTYCACPSYSTITTAAFASSSTAAAEDAAEKLKNTRGPAANNTTTSTADDDVWSVLSQISRPFFDDFVGFVTEQSKLQLEEEKTQRIAAAAAMGTNGLPLHKQKDPTVVTTASSGAAAAATKAATLFNNIFSVAIKLLNHLEMKHSRTIFEYLKSSSSSSSAEEEEKQQRACIVGFVTSVSSIRHSFADLALCLGEYMESINAYLGCRPPSHCKAVEAARSMGNWSLALSIASRYPPSTPATRGGGTATAAGGSTGAAVLGNSEWIEKLNFLGYRTSVRIAQEIVSEFKENQEGSGLTDGISSGGVGSSSSSNSSSSVVVGGTAGEATGDDKVLEAARLAVDYCGDMESAVGILITGRKWLRAIEVASKASRFDLMSEVASAVRSTANELLDTLPKRSAKMEVLVNELNVLWQDPADRMQKVATTDVSLHEELNGGANNKNGDVSDNASEYSAATQNTAASYSSFRSTSSSSSQSSNASAASSSMSVSVLSASLSQLSRTSNKTAGGGGSGDGDDDNNQSFSIQGISHALLSRGKGGEEKKKKKRQDSERQQKRRERSKNKVSSRDIYGVGRELELCELMWSFAQVGSLASTVRSLCDALSVLNSFTGTDAHTSGGGGGGSSSSSAAARFSVSDSFIASMLQAEFSRYVDAVMSHPPPIAPPYPAEWLIRKSMTVLIRYQDLEGMELQARREQPSSFFQGGGHGGEDGGGGGGAAADAAATWLLPFSNTGLAKLRAAGESLDSWWKVAADGIKVCHTLRLLTLSDEEV